MKPPPDATFRPVRTHLAGEVRPSTGQGGFTLVETAVAATLITLFLSSMFLLNTLALRMLRSGNETAAASQILQARAEQLRSSSWLNITNSDFVMSQVLARSPPTAIVLSDLTETISAGPYQPAGTTKAGPAFVLQRTPAGAVTSTGGTGASLANSDCVQFTITERWTGWGGRTRERTIVTLASTWGSGQQ